jgi:NADH:ubiquinone oxidoreductase subunit 3 (subunit A)
MDSPSKSSQQAPGSLILSSAATVVAILFVLIAPILASLFATLVAMTTFMPFSVNVMVVLIAVLSLGFLFREVPE